MTCKREDPAFQLLAWVASSLAKQKAHVADFGCVWDRNFPTKITAQIMANF